MNPILLRLGTALLITISSVTVNNPDAPQGETLSAQTEIAQAHEATISAAPAPVSSPVATPEPTADPIEVEKTRRIAVLQAFLEKYNSPMAPNAKDFVETAYKYDLDWRLLPAIAGTESTFGKHVPAGSHNPFGWGNGKIRFNSWADAIDTVGRKISEKYVKRGLDTPYKMQPVYAPPSHTWGGKVTSFMEKIEATPANSQ